MRSKSKREPAKTSTIELSSGVHSDQNLGCGISVMEHEGEYSVCFVSPTQIDIPEATDSLWIEAADSWIMEHYPASVEQSIRDSEDRFCFQIAQSEYVKTLPIVFHESDADFNDVRVYYRVTDVQLFLHILNSNRFVKPTVPQPLGSLSAALVDLAGVRLRNDFKQWTMSNPDLFHRVTSKDNRLECVLNVDDNEITAAILVTTETIGLDFSCFFDPSNWQGSPPMSEKEKIDAEYDFRRNQVLSLLAGTMFEVDSHNKFPDGIVFYCSVPVGLVPSDGVFDALGMIASRLKLVAARGVIGYGIRIS